MAYNPSLTFLNPETLEKHNPQPKVRPNLSIRQVIQLSNNGSFKQQYHHVYIDRYEVLCQRFDGLHPSPVSKIDGNTLISGIIKKKYKKLLRKVGSKKSAMPLDTANFAEPFVLYDDGDIVEIEDESGKMQISFSDKTKVHYKSESFILANTEPNLKNIPFGVMVATNGYIDQKTGKFVCQNVYFPQIPQQSPLISNMGMTEQHLNILIASDLRSKDYQTLIQLLEFQNRLGSQIQTLILCGDLLKESLEGSEKYSRLDGYLSHLSNLVNIVVLPDNGGKQWPHKPLVPFFIKESYKYVVRAHNPTLLQLQDRHVLVTNGENITQSHRVCPLTNPLDIMESHLIYNHIAPYSPSTFKSIPLNKDSFVLESLPQLYIAAKQTQFSTRLYQNKADVCRLITVPSMSEGIVIVNSRTLVPEITRIVDLYEKIN